MRNLSAGAGREILIVSLLTILGAVLRFASFADIGLTHFDEGIYALSGLWVISPGGLANLDPMVIPYAPPGFPILVGLAYCVFGVADVSAIFASCVCGVLTIPAAGWVARRTFGAGAGGAASAFACWSMAHIAFSRKALTDAPFLLAWLIAIGLGGRFLERPRFGRAIALGAAVGIAQNLKYNGWIAGAIVILAAVAGVLVSAREGKASGWVRTFGYGAVAVLLAALAYWPWYQFVEAHGGYGALVRHHRNYMGGAQTWVPNWRQQMAQLVALSAAPYWGMYTWGCAWLACALATSGLRLFTPSSRWGWMRFRLGLLGGIAAFAALPTLPWWIGLLTVPSLFRESKPDERLLAVWWIILSVMTPFYHPYARLWLPLHAAGWLVAGGLVVKLGPFQRSVETDGSLATSEDPWAVTRRWFRTVPFVVPLVIAMAETATSEGVPLDRSRFVRPTTQFRRVAADLRRGLPTKTADHSDIKVLARRPLAFYLLTSGGVRFSLQPDSRAIVENARRGDVVLLDWTQLQSEEDPSDSERRMAKWPSVGHWVEQLDPVTLLDVDPSAAVQRRHAHPADVDLLRVR